jgi:predicted nuclease with RNAse H fold
MWAGVDVGGRRKGFHVAIINAEGLVFGPARAATSTDVVELVRSAELVAVDSPRRPARDGARSRSCERDLAQAVCGIRYTPARALLNGNAYYEWILHGLELYAALEAAGIAAIECFPTASFTRWAGPRGQRTRAAWTSEALGFAVPHGQDGRDAVAAALTARSASAGLVDEFGEIVVPRAQPSPQQVGIRREEGHRQSGQRG